MELAQPATSGGQAGIAQAASCGFFAAPAGAAPFLGHGLDPRLFQVSALERAEHGGRLPVRIRYHGSRPWLPGVIITRAAHGVATGYLTRAPAPAFGAALARQYSADHARGSYGTDGLFADGVTLALAGPASPPPPTVRPQSPMHTLTMHGTNSAGHPDTGDLAFVFNADNCNRFADPAKNTSVFRHGVAKFSVPDGYYWAVGNFLSPHGQGLVNRVVVRPQFNVNRNVPISLDARTATSRITFATPRPAVTQGFQLELRRDNPAGPPAFVDVIVHHATMLVNPLRQPPSVGSLHASVDAELTSPPGCGLPYAYAVAFADPPGLIGSQHYIVRQSSLATVKERFFQDPPTAGAWETGGGFSTQIIFSGDGTGLKLPGRQVQYSTARPDVIWSTT